MTKQFGERMRHARERAGLSKAQLARELGISSQSVANWENRISEPRSEQRDIALDWVEEIESGSSKRRVRTANSNLRENSHSNGDGTRDLALRSLRNIYDYWPQSRIAEALNVSQATISTWLRTGNVAGKYSDALTRLEMELTDQEVENSEFTLSSSDTHPEETPYADWLRSSLVSCSVNNMN